MSIEERCNDAEFLWSAGRKQGALLSVLIAIAACAKQKYPNESDREGFEKFVFDNAPWRLSAEFRQKPLSLETIIYKWLRCELVHSAELPLDLVMVEGKIGVLSLRAGGGDSENSFELSETWFWCLLRIARCFLQSAEIQSSAPHNKF